jgi:hypothetical protein
LFLHCGLLVSLLLLFDSSVILLRKETTKSLPTSLFVKGGVPPPLAKGEAGGFLSFENDASSLWIALQYRASEVSYQECGGY